MHGEGPTQGWGGQVTRGAHLEHVAHGRDLGRVEAERLVEGRRVLPSRRAGMGCEKRCAAREARGRWVAVTHAACMGRDRPKCRPQRARAERTRNMRYMVVTLEVSQLEMSALKFCKPLKR